MPRIDFVPENKVQKTNFDFPKLKLKAGERARVVVMENPVINYVHTLRKPQVINGVPQMVTETRRDGTEYQAHKKDFLSTPLCLGDFETLSKDGSDPKNCPICKMAQEHPDWVQAPKPRYAMHVVRYKTKAGGFDPITPYSIEVLVWAFAASVFNKIIEAKEEWGDLKSHDLLLGPCENESFQKFDINVGSKGLWQEDEERKRLTLETFANNQIPDLDIATGSKKEARWIEEDLNQIRQSWALVAGASAVDTEEIGGATLSQDLTSLLDEPVEKVALAKDVAVPVAESAVTVEVTQAPVIESPKADKPAEVAPASDFDDLLANL